MNSHYFKYVIGHLTAPLSFLLLVLSFSFVLMLLNKWQRFAKFGMAGALLLLYLFCTTYGSNWITAPLEYQYATYKQGNKPLNYIVVLGCSHDLNEELPESSVLHRCSQVRVHEALLVYQQNPGAKVIFSGGGFNQTSLAENMAKFAAVIGVKKEHIILEKRPVNTEQEVTYISPVIAGSNSALVTSATHMPRAMYLFSRNNITPIPAPTDFLVRNRELGIKLKYFIPEAENLLKVESAAHEYYGFAWLKLKAWLF